MHLFTIAINLVQLSARPLMAEADPWLRILLRCQVTHAPLDDPAKGTRCAHQAVCNFKNLCHRKKCPIAGCAAVWYPHRVTRDEALKAIIERARDGLVDGSIRSKRQAREFTRSAIANNMDTGSDIS